MYYDEYYALDSRISIEKLASNTHDTDSTKTAKALFELADIESKELIKADSFEDFIAELEATEAIISSELFKYWKTNTNLNIRFAIDKRIDTSNPQNHRILEHVLDIRVLNMRSGVSLPLQNRSKGFNWFFSFLVWFKRIQESKGTQFILLLDEPGLNLHASAQADLLRFIESLSDDYQIIYTTHSPFMIGSDDLHRVRTVLETQTGSKISDSVQEKDPNTLFPLQAALGYDIAQNLFINKRNLLVEGISDLVFLQYISAQLIASGKDGLRDDIVIVPTGGLDKVATFVSLLRGSDLEIACLLDTPQQQKTASAIERLIYDKLIKDKSVLYYDSFVDTKSACDIEDCLTPTEYVNMFNGAFDTEHKIDLTDLNLTQDTRIVEEIAKAIGKPRYNHYRPAKFLLTNPVDLDPDTLRRFETIFELVNRQYK